MEVYLLWLYVYVLMAMAVRECCPSEEGFKVLPHHVQFSRYRGCIKCGCHSTTSYLIDASWVKRKGAVGIIDSSRCLDVQSRTRCARPHGYGMQFMRRCGPLVLDIYPSVVCVHDETRQRNIMMVCYNL